MLVDAASAIDASLSIPVPPMMRVCEPMGGQCSNYLYGMRDFWICASALFEKSIRIPISSSQLLRLAAPLLLGAHGCILKKAAFFASWGAPLAQLLCPGTIVGWQL